MGEDTADIGEGFSKYREEIKALSGVDIMKDEHTFKDMYDIFTQLAAVWDKMPDTSQSRVAEILGGTRNSSGIMSTITNIKDAVGAYSDAMNSAGAATQANDIYMDTTAAKLGVLKASFQELSSDVVDSDLMKLGTGALTGIITGVDTLTKSIGGLNTVLAGVALSKFIKSYRKLEDDPDSTLSSGQRAAQDAFPIIGKIQSSWKAAKEAASKAASAGAGSFGKMKAGAKGFVEEMGGVQTAMLGVTAAYTAFEVVYNIYRAHREKMDALAAQAGSEGQKLQETTTSLDEYRDKIIDLRTQLASGTLTDGEAYTAKAQLLAIQQQLTASYGDQAAGIDLVNGRLSEQIGLVDRLSASEAQKYLNENETGIEEATKQMEKTRSYSLGNFTRPISDDQKDALEKKMSEISDKYGGVFDEVLNQNASGYTIEFTGDVSQAKDAINELMTYMRSENANVDGAFDALIANSGSAMTEINETLGKYQEAYKSAQEARLIADTSLYSGSDGQKQMASKWLSDYADAVEEYNNALASGDEKAISAAKEKYEGLKSVMDGLASESMSQYADQIAEIANQLNAASAGAEKLKELLSASGGDTDIIKAVNDLRGLKLDDVDLLDAINTDGIQTGEEAFNKFVQAAVKAGIVSDDSAESVQLLINMLVQLGVIGGDPVGGIDATTNAVERLKSSIETLQSVQTQVQTALSNSRSATGMTADDIENLEKAYKGLDSYNPYKLFETTANGVHLNRDEVKRLNEELANSKIKAFDDEIEELQKKIADYRSKGKDTSALESQLQSAKLLRNELEGTLSAYNALQDAMATPSERDPYEDIGNNYEAMKKKLENGWAGDESLNAYLDLLLNADQRTGNAAEDFQKLTNTIEGTSHSLMDYWTVNDDGEFTTQGLENFLQDVNKKLGDQYAKINENGQWEFDFNNGKLEDVARAFGTTTEAVELFERALADAGFAIDLTDIDFTGQVNKAISSLKELQGEGRISTSIDLDFDVDEMSSKEIWDKLYELKSERFKIDPEVDPEAAAALDELISKLEKDYELKVNAKNGDGGVDDAEQGLSRVAKWITDINNTDVDDKEVKIDGDNSGYKGAKREVEEQSVPDKKVNVIANAQKAIKKIAYVSGMKVPSKVFSITANDGASWKLNTIKSILSSIQSKTVTVTARYQGTGFGSVVGGIAQNAIGRITGNATGTANARYPYKSYATGTNWSLLQDENSLVNELGTESIVRDGRWFTIPGGAHIEQLKKGDIVFSAEQTKELIRSGRVISGGGHGRIAMATGSAFNTLNAYDKGSGSFTRPSSNSTGLARRDPSGNSSGSNSRSSNSDSSKENEPQKKDWIEVAISRLEQAINKFATVAESAFKTLSERLSSNSEEMTTISRELKVQQDGYNRYLQEANKVGLSRDIAAKIWSGTIDINEYDSDTSDKISKYEEWYEKALDCSEAILDLKESLGELYSDRFDNIETEYENKLSLLEHLTNTYNNGIDDIETRGYLATTKYYEELRKVEQKNIELRKEELADLTTAMSQAVNSGYIKEGSEQWYDFQQRINDVKESIQESETSMIDFANSIRETKWDHFDYLQEQISNITKEADFMIDLLSHSNLYEDNGQFNELGSATLGLHGQNYNVYMAQADKYAEEIKRLNEEIANDPNNTKLLDRKEDLLEAQRDAILAAEDEKDAIVDLVRDGIELELDALKELIDKYEDSLDSAKDLYDYQKNLKDQTSEIARLQKQLQAYAGDTSEENKSVVQKIQVSLAEAMDDLEETQYEHYISEQKKLLDNLYDEYEKILNERLDNVDALIADMIDTVNTNSASIGDTLIKESEKVGYTLSDSMKEIWANDGGAFSIITKYGEMFGAELTSVNEVLRKISARVAKMVGESDDVANDVVDNTKPSTPTDTSADPIVSENKTVQPDNSKNNQHSSSARSDTDYYGVALAICNGLHGWGVGNDRRNKLTSKGFDYNRVQSIVNQLYKDGYIRNGSWRGRYNGITDLSPYGYDRFANGGLVRYTGLAQLDGSPSSPEAVLNPSDTKNFITLRDAMRSIADKNTSLSDLIGTGSGASSLLRDIVKASSIAGVRGTSVGSVTYQINIPIDHVEDYNDFMNKMRDDSKFEKMLQSMTIDQLVGGSRLDKNKYRW